MVATTNKRNNLKKKDITKSIFLNIGISESYAAKIVNDLIDILILTLISKKKIKIKNFGSFKLQMKTERMGRNPKNKKLYKILPRTVVTFRAAKELKLKINKNEKK
tara:strand:- start:380 stop:697 length:318 start_codon:yes stop_codon:yes gene_type:complete